MAHDLFLSDMSIFAVNVQIAMKFWATLSLLRQQSWIYMEGDMQETYKIFCWDYLSL